MRDNDKIAAIIMSAALMTGALNPLTAQITSGPQVWNCDYWQSVELGDFYGLNLELQKNPPRIALEGARNGWYSGYVVVTSAEGPLNELKAELSAMKGPGAALIAPEHLQIRYPLAGGKLQNWLPTRRFDGLMAAPPAEIETVQVKATRAWKPKNEGPVAMQPVWVTVYVPKDAAAGDYSAKLEIAADGMDAFDVPVTLKVHEWTLPDARDFSVQNLAVSSPERLAERYGVERWSERHYELMGESLAQMLQLGSRQLLINMVSDYPAQLNEESMVRWIRKADGSYDHDFTIVDRYFDVAAKTIGKPFPIRLNLWCFFDNDDEKRRTVTLLDPASGKLEKLAQPVGGSEESYLFWKPVLDGIRERAEKRGWFDSVTVNWMEYCGGPTTNYVALLHRIWPDGKWSSWDHGRRTSFLGPTKAQNMPCIVNSTVWNEGAHKLRGYKNAFKPGFAYGGHARNFHQDNSTLMKVRITCEQLIMKGCSGADPVGADLFPVADPKRNWNHMWVAFALGCGNATRAYLAPAEKGLVATERFEAFREGVQLCEALVFMQRAIESGKLSAELAEKIGKGLDERGQALMDSFIVQDKSGRRSFDPPSWAKVARVSDTAIYALAAETAAALK